MTMTGRERAAGMNDAAFALEGWVFGGDEATVGGSLANLGRLFAVLLIGAALLGVWTCWPLAVGIYALPDPEPPGWIVFTFAWLVAAVGALVVAVTWLDTSQRGR